MLLIPLLSLAAQYNLWKWKYIESLAFVSSNLDENEQAVLQNRLENLS